MKTPILFLSLILAAVILSPAQTSPVYSESAAYTPREFPGKKDKRSKRSGKPAALPSSLIIPVSVLDAKGALVSDLKQSDFAVHVDGQPAEIESFAVADDPVNVMVLVDVSPSISHENKELAEMTRNVIRQFRPQDRISLVRFAGEMKTLNDFTTDREILDKSVKKLTIDDGTGIYDAVADAVSEGFPNVTGRKAIVIITDAVDTTSYDDDYRSSLEAAERAGIPVFPVYLDTYGRNQAFSKPGAVMGRPGIRSSRLPQELIDQMIRSNPRLANRSRAGLAVEEYELGRHYLNDLMSLSGGCVVNPAASIPTTIADQLARQYVLTVKTPAAVSPNARKQIRVRVSRPDLAVINRATFLFD